MEGESGKGFRNPEATRGVELPSILRASHIFPLLFIYCVHHYRHYEIEHFIFCMHTCVFLSLNLMVSHRVREKYTKL